MATPGYATCPGCGDRSDAAHIAACVALVRAGQAQEHRTARLAGWLQGARYVVRVMRLQLQRRGAVDFDRLDDAITALFVNGETPE